MNLQVVQTAFAFTGAYIKNRNKMQKLRLMNFFQFYPVKQLDFEGFYYNIYRSCYALFLMLQKYVSFDRVQIVCARYCRKMFA